MTPSLALAAPSLLALTCATPGASQGPRWSWLTACVAAALTTPLITWSWRLQEMLLPGGPCALCRARPLLHQALRPGAGCCAAGPAGAPRTRGRGAAARAAGAAVARQALARQPAAAGAGCGGGRGGGRRSSGSHCWGGLQQQQRGGVLPGRRAVSGCGGGGGWAGAAAPAG